jgi:hypothetical protein
LNSTIFFFLHKSGTRKLKIRNFVPKSNLEKHEELKDSNV